MTRPWRLFDTGTDQILVADFQTGNGGVVINEIAGPVPEPASIALLGVALPSVAAAPSKDLTESSTSEGSSADFVETGVLLIAAVRPTATFGPTTQLLITDRRQYRPEPLVANDGALVDLLNLIEGMVSQLDSIVANRRPIQISHFKPRQRPIAHEPNVTPKQL